MRRLESILVKPNTFKMFIKSLKCVLFLSIMITLKYYYHILVSEETISYFVGDFPTGIVAFLLGTLNVTFWQRETKQATRPGDKVEAAHSTCPHQDTQWNGHHTGSCRQARMLVVLDILVCSPNGMTGQRVRHNSLYFS